MLIVFFFVLIINYLINNLINFNIIIIVKLVILHYINLIFNCLLLVFVIIVKNFMYLLFVIIDFYCYINYHVDIIIMVRPDDVLDFNNYHDQHQILYPNHKIDPAAQTDNLLIF